MRNIEGIFLARERIIYPNAVYHITHRAPGRELLFIDNGDYLYMFSLIKNIPKKFNWKIFKDFTIYFLRIYSEIRRGFYLRNSALSFGISCASDNIGFSFLSNLLIGTVTILLNLASKPKDSI